MSADTHNLKKNEFQLTGSLKRKGYDWWWHSFTAYDAETGEERPFFIEFFIINPALAKETPTLGQALENKDKNKPSYMMVKAGAWGKNPVQLHRFFSFNDVNINPKAPFEIGAEDCILTENHTEGSICVTPEDALNPGLMSDSGEISWDLEIDKKIPFNVGYGTSEVFRKIKAFEMYWHAEGIKTFYTGTITLNGKNYVVIPEKSYGYADKNWGRNFTSPWIWLASSNLYSKTRNCQLENSAFDIGGGRPKIYFLPISRKLLGCLYLEGVEYEFNFSKFWTKSKTEFDCKITDKEVIWHVQMYNRDYIWLIDCTSPLDEMVNVNYESPDGKKRYNNLKNGGNAEGIIKLLNRKTGEVIEEIIAKNIGCEYGVYDN